MEHTFNQFGEKYLDRIDRMYPQLRPLTDTFREIKGIKHTAANPTISKMMTAEVVNPVKIETVLIFKHKMEHTPAPPLPDPDCLPLYVDGKRLFIRRRSNDGMTILDDFVDASTPEWQGIAKRIKATLEYRTALMALNDSEFEEYLEYLGRQRKTEQTARPHNDDIIQSHRRAKANF